MKRNVDEFIFLKEGQLKMICPKWIALIGFVVFATAFNSTASAHHGKCIHTNTSVFFEGDISRRKVFGPPNFGDTPSIDEVRHIWVIHPRHPVNVCQGRDDFRP